MNLTEGHLSLADSEATEKAGAALAMAYQQINNGASIWLEGNLGAGKTTLSRGLLRALGHQGAVKSPTYTLVEPYQCGDLQVFHFDLYRLQDPEELEYMGAEDYFKKGNLCLVEWPQQGEGWLPAADLHIQLLVDGDSRQLSWHSLSQTGQAIAHQAFCAKMS